MKPLRILLADDHDVVRRGLRALLGTHPGWEVCGEAVTGRDAVEKARQLNPDIAVIDISMPELNGLEATRQIRKECPQTEVLVVTIHESDQIVRAVLEAGARGYILKSDSDDNLILAVEALRAHKPFFTARATEMLLCRFGRDGRIRLSPEEAVPCRLTPREREIVQLLAEGKSNKEVARILSISVKTAETHRANIMRKLELHSMSELVRYAIRNHIVQA